MYKVTFSASKYTEESLAFGISDNNGYVDLDWNPFIFLEEGDKAIIECDTLEEAEAKIEEYLGETSKERGNYYAEDSRQDDEGNTWSYAGHVEEVTE